MEIVNPDIESYLYGLLEEKDALHSDIESFAATRKFQVGDRTIPFPIIGKLVGRTIYQLARLIKARRVLELGSGFGYSAYWFAKALGPKGEIILTDGSEENLDAAKGFLSRIPRRPKLRFKKGNALEILNKVSGKFDIIFNDIDKHDYPQVFRKAIPRIKKGGLLITDNVLWSGAVLQPETADRSTRGIIEFNRLICDSPDLITTINPIRDGLAVCLKT